MCKTWDLIYSCGHTFHIRLSKCRATVYTQSRPGRPFRPACLGDAALRFKKTYPCGDCASKAKVDELHDLCARFEVGTAERDEADAEAGRELLRVSKAYPVLERRKRSKPLERCGLPPKELRGSLLKTEVRRDEIEAEEVNDDWAAYYEEWGQGWTITSDGGEETPSWESADTREGASLVPWECEPEDVPYEQDVGNPWADDSDELDSDLTPIPCCDTQAANEPWIELETENEIVLADQEQVEEQSTSTADAFNTQATSAYQNQIEEQSANTTYDSPAKPLLQEFPNGVSAGTPQTTASDKSSDTRSAPTTPTYVTFSDDQVKSTGNHKFKTLPPHLRHRVASFNNRRVSTSDCSDSEILDVLEQFKCFQLQTVITVST